MLEGDNCSPQSLAMERKGNVEFVTVADIMSFLSKSHFFAYFHPKNAKKWKGTYVRKLNV